MKNTLQSTVSKADSPLTKEIAKRDPWFHNLHLPGDVHTAPNHPFGDFPKNKWDKIAPHLPDSFKGWTALDVGCNAGFYSFELAKRGAEVTGLEMDSRYLDQARWAAAQLGMEDQVTFREGNVYQVLKEETQYDFVCFMGVFYHLRYPLLALDALARRTRKCFLFQTLSVPNKTSIKDIPEHTAWRDREVLRDPDWPHMSFIEHCFAGDPTNWWVPNTAAAEAMLRSAGLRIVHHLGEDIWICEPGSAHETAPAQNAEAQFQSIADGFR